MSIDLVFNTELNKEELESEDHEKHRYFEADCHLQEFSSDSFVLHINGNGISNSQIAVALSDRTCVVYDVACMKKEHYLTGHKAPISNVRFSPTDEQLVYSSSLDGKIRLWDLRKGNDSVKEFKDDSEGMNKLKPITDFTISCDDKFLVGGTELIEEDSYILFWDIRSSKLLGGYWESHTDDITQVCFHPSKKDTLVTASTDGLINVFDVSKSCEDDALLHCLNTESSVGKIHWFSGKDGTDFLSCITHTEDLQFWKPDDVCPFLQFSRETISKLMSESSTESCNIIDLHASDKPETFFLVADCSAREGECLQMFSICEKKIEPHSSLEGNKQIVRASWYDEINELLITGGESGILSLWKPYEGSKREATEF